MSGPDHRNCVALPLSEVCALPSARFALLMSSTYYNSIQKARRTRLNNRLSNVPAFQEAYDLLMLFLCKPSMQPYLLYKTESYDVCLPRHSKGFDICSMVDACTYYIVATRKRIQARHGRPTPRIRKSMMSDLFVIVLTTHI